MQTLVKTVLYSDMDGTLIGNNQKISLENVAAIRRFILLGGRFSIATGRSETIAAPFLREIPLNAPAILYNGAAVYDFERREFLYRAILDDAIVRIFAEAATEIYPEVCVEIYSGGAIKLINPRGVMDHYILAENQPHEQVEMTDGFQAMKMIFYGENDRLREIEQRIHGLRKDGYVSTFSAPFYLEILPQGVSKGSAFSFVIDHLGYNREEFAAIGDFYNDVEMLRAAALGAAPGNAPEDVKAQAGLIVADNDHSAVADFILGHLINERAPEGA